MDVGSFLNSLGEAHDRREADVGRRERAVEKTQIRKGRDKCTKRYLQI